MRVHSTSAIFLLALPFVCSCAALPAPVAPQYYGGFQTTAFVDVGARKLDSSFDPVRDTSLLGVQLDIRQPNDSTGLELGLFHSSESKSENVAGVGRVDFDSSSSEFSIGGRWKYSSILGRLRPVVGAGVSAIVVDYSADPVNSSSSSASGWTLGPYVHAGLEYPLGDHFILAVDYRRLLFTDVIRKVDLDGVKTDANYSEFSFSIGYTF